MKFCQLSWLMLFSLLIFLWNDTAAQVPRTMNYQGRLTDNAGEPVEDGDYTIFFKIYDAAEDGSILWSSDRMIVGVEDGMFSVRLGPFQNTLFSSDSSRWLGITVLGDDEIYPRTQLVTVPYAFYAKESAPSTPIMWSGGCSSHGQLVGLLTYCTDVEDFNTASGYLNVTPGGTFTVETAGYYRINAWTANLSALAAHATVIKNGSPIYENSYNTQGDWVTLMADVTWYFESGDTFRVDYYSNSGDYNYYSYDGSCCYSRLQVTYVGP
ncbi:MAG: hypothetical protein GWO41_12635 [candidate division Zixibacteria bacterium]|nr:hypothetical protein [candidate division Zixibacteria bacterium]NIR62745.1 hypothetical protein [candidate division Zixibacteria bacterium]NIS17197.1 hypothetical protein [candidate division Zixibacteria bacterium]NIS44815.1 hypothetical protein [candidate division Zixibacteria bacterium]NIT53550.1 hypothetical protein [candidate division Zixibacteria bacterium]